MPFEIFLALRYLKSRRKRRLARVTALVAVLGIAVGVAALIVALSLSNGFRDEMRVKILRGTAHITVAPVGGQPLTDFPNIANRIKNVGGVTDVARTTYDGAVLVGPQSPGYAVLRGVDLETESALSDLKSVLVAGSVDRLTERSASIPSVVIGAKLAAGAGLNVGDNAELILANRSGNPARRLVHVAGLFRWGLFEYDSTWIYLSLDQAAKFSGSGNPNTVITVRLADIYDTPRAAAEIRSALGSSYSTMDWQEANAPLFNALALERRMGLFIIILIILIAAMNITSTLILVVVERGRDIGILSAMGASGKSVLVIFMIEGAIIGLIGGACGVIIGLITCAIGNRYKLVSLPADVYSISNVPFHSQTRDVILAALVALLLSLLATIYPARAAARVRPVQMLRDS